MKLKFLTQKLDIYVCDRSKVVPRLVIRPARVEDHDDLVPIFNKKSELNPGNPTTPFFLSEYFLKRTTELHSQYYLATLISQSTEAKSGSRVLVATVKDRAVGLMGLTTAFDVQPLRKAFFLEPFNFLKSSDSIYL